MIDRKKRLRLNVSAFFSLLVKAAAASVILLTEYHAVKSVFDGCNPPGVDEIAFAMKSPFAGL